MTRLLPLLAVAVVLAVLPSCRKSAEFERYDNTSEREAFYKRYNAKVAADIAKRKSELEAELAGALDDKTREEKVEEFDGLLLREQRPAYFEEFTETDLPKDLNWETNYDEPELGSPEAKKGGTFHSYIPGGGYPPTIRACRRCGSHRGR